MTRSHRSRLLILLLALAAFAVRLWRIDEVPPGWRVDELSNVYAVSQNILDGHWRFFYPDASGQEVLHHALVALMVRLTGYHPLAMRFVALVAGTLLVPATWQVGRRLVGHRVALTAAALLVVSFWSLIYSRTGLRQIDTPFFLLVTFWWFWQGLTVAATRAWKPLLMAGAASGIGLYTYFAAWGTPLILGAFVAWLWLFRRAEVRGRMGALAGMFALTGLLALPLVRDMVRAGAESADTPGRVSEVAAPLHALLAGDPAPVWHNLVGTLGMFHATGDPEWLYNIADRPVFSLAVGLLFWSGVALAAWGAWRGDRRLLFLLLWWGAGIAPAFLSVPPASLGHTILALPAVFLLVALPTGWLARANRPTVRQLAAPAALLLVMAVATRDLPAYFVEWPQRGMVRFHHHAAVAEVARHLHREPGLTDFGIAGWLVEPWEQVALSADAPANIRPRWFQKDRALLLETAEGPARNFVLPEAGPFEPLLLPEWITAAGEYRLREVAVRLPQGQEPVGCFVNGFCLESAEYTPPLLDLVWRVAAPLDLPPVPLYSFPPPPGVYDGPRLTVFAHLWADGGEWLAGDDGLWVNPHTLQPGDRFIQRHLLPPADRATTVAVGLYDPLDGRRILTLTGQDHIRAIILP